MAETAGFVAIDAPVSGCVPGATAGSLTFMVGAAAADLAAAGPVPAAMGQGRALRPRGRRAGREDLQQRDPRDLDDRGQRGVRAGGELGLSHQALFDVASAASGQCWALTGNWPVSGPVPAGPANHDDRAGFAAALMAKDFELAAGAVKAAGLPVELGLRAAELHADFAAAEGAGLDFSAIITTLREGASRPVGEYRPTGRGRLANGPGRSAPGNARECREAARRVGPDSRHRFEPRISVTDSPHGFPALRRRNVPVVLPEMNSP